MNITFLIGNGFDLRLGMKTKFTDMYDSYITRPSASQTIKRFKGMLKADAPGYSTWGDFEMAMAQKAQEFDDEDAFIECLRDFKIYMAEHLRREQEEFRRRMAVSADSKMLCKNEISTSIDNFYTGLIPNEINELERMGIHLNPRYSVINFNYTNIFDTLMPASFNFVHVHGTLDTDVVLGVDNMGQISELPYKTSKRFNRAFVKPEFNERFDIARVRKAERMIEESNVICIYGMSLGKSDQSWITQLKNWLLFDQSRHLIYYMHDKRQFNRINSEAIVTEEEDRIATLLGRICDSSEEIDRIFNQIHIPVGVDIFDVDYILISEKMKTEETNKRREAIRKRLEERPRELGIS